jgi:Fe-S oxidoreductase
MDFVGPSRLVMADSRLLPAVSTWLDPFFCIRCRACDDACPQGVAIDALVGTMRGAAFREAKELLPCELREACARVAGGGPLRPDGDPRVPAPGAVGAGAGDYVLFSGCAASLRDRAAEAALMGRAGASFSAGIGACCGAFEASCGAPEAEERVARFLEALRARGTFQVATGDARCYAFLRSHPRTRGEIQATHVLEIASEVRASLAAGEPEEAPRVTYHDPCDLVRVPGGADLPREALRRAGAEIVEMRRIRREAPCCGMAGGTWTFNPALAEELGRARVREAKATGAPVLLTQAPLCRDHLARCAALEGGGIEVQSVVEFVVARAGIAIPELKLPAAEAPPPEPPRAPEPPAPCETAAGGAGIAPASRDRPPAEAASPPPEETSVAGS